MSTSSSDEIEELFRDCGDLIEEVGPTPKLQNVLPDGEELDLMEVEVEMDDNDGSGGASGGDGGMNAGAEADDQEEAGGGLQEGVKDAGGCGAAVGGVENQGQGQPQPGPCGTGDQHQQEEDVGSVVVIDMPAVSMVEKLRKEYEGNIDIGTTLFEYHSEQVKKLTAEMRERTQEAEKIKADLGLERLARYEQSQGSAEAIRKLMEEIVLINTKLRALEENREEELRNLKEGIEVDKLERDEKSLQLLERIDKGEKGREEEIQSLKMNLEAERRGKTEFVKKVLEKIDNSDKERKEEIDKLKMELEQELEQERKERQESEQKLLQSFVDLGEAHKSEVETLRLELETERSQRKEDELKLLEKLEKSEEYLRKGAEVVARFRMKLDAKNMKGASQSSKDPSPVNGESKDGAENTDSPEQLPEDKQKLMEIIYKLEQEIAVIRKQVRELKRDKDSNPVSPQPQPETVPSSSTQIFEESQSGMEMSMTDKVDDLANDVDARLQDFGRNQQALHEKIMNLEEGFISLRHIVIPPASLVLMNSSNSAPPPGSSFDQSIMIDDGTNANHGRSHEQYELKYHDDSNVTNESNETNTSQIVDTAVEEPFGTRKRKRNLASPIVRRTTNKRVKLNGSEKHARVSAPSKVILCVCGQRFSHKSHLIKHIKYFSVVKNLKLETRERKSARKDLKTSTKKEEVLPQGRKSNTASPDKRESKVTSPKKTSPTKSTKTGLLQQHGRDPTSTKALTKCICGKAFGEPNNLLKHIKMVRQKVPVLDEKKPAILQGPKTETLDDDNDRESKATSSKRKTAGLNRKKSKSKETGPRSEQHGRDASTPGTMWRCLCSRKFARQKQLTRHLQYYGAGTRKYTCHLCGRVLGFPSDLKRHLGWHERKNTSASASLKASPVKTEDPQGEEPTSPTKLVTRANSRLANESESQSQPEQKPTHCLNKKTKVKGTTVYICKCGKRYFTHSGFKRHVKSFPWN